MFDLVFRLVIFVIFIGLSFYYGLRDIEINGYDENEKIKQISSWYNFIDYSVKVLWFVIIPLVVYLLWR